jgi:hypothetical protein
VSVVGGQTAKAHAAQAHVSQDCREVLPHALCRAVLCRTPALRAVRVRLLSSVPCSSRTRMHSEFRCQRALHRRHISCHQPHAIVRSRSARQCETVPFRPPVRVCRHSCVPRAVRLHGCLHTFGLFQTGRHRLVISAALLAAPRTLALAMALFFSTVVLINASLLFRSSGTSNNQQPQWARAPPSPHRLLQGSAEPRGHCVARVNI